MDAASLKREKERVKKRKQRERLKENKDKYANAKKNDAERKKNDRLKLRENVEKHPRKYKAVVDKMRQQTAERVRKHRQNKRQSLDVQASPQTPTPQQLRREKERIREAVADSRKKKQHETDSGRKRVRNFRLRVKLVAAFFDADNQQPATSNPGDPDIDSGYRHKSSESRAVKRARESLPETPAKKVCVIEKLVVSTTPRSRHRLCQNPSLQAIFIGGDSRKKLETQFNIAKSVKESVSTSSKTKKRFGLHVVASKLVKKSRNMASAARMLGVPRHALARSATMNDKRKERKDKVSKEDANLVQDFYLDEASRQMPNQRDVLLLKDESGNKVPTQKHIMEMSQQEAYSKFKEQNPSVSIGQRKFDYLKPQQVRQTKCSNRIVCCCTYCENVRLKVQALNQFTGQSFKSSSEIVDDTMCKKTGAYNKSKCITRECDACGTKKLCDCYNDQLCEKGDKVIKWKEWKKCTVPLDEHRHVTRVLRVDREDTFDNFMNKELRPALEPHAQHQFRAYWQSAQFRENVNTIKPGELVMAMDFAENYTCRYGREIQSFHWNQKQVTIHPMMLYYKPDGGDLQKEGFVCITDDLKHDTHAVSRFETEAIAHVRSKGVEVNAIHEWTDGCASQYKGRQSFAAISQGEQLHEVHITRNYFETSHGKGPCDGLGGIVKNKISRAVVQNPAISVANAKEIHKFCDDNLSNVGQSTFQSRTNRYSANTRTFKHVESIDRTSSTTAKTMKGSRKLHCVSSIGVGYQLRARDISCYCPGCRSDSECENSQYVSVWSTRVLKPVDSIQTVDVGGSTDEEEQVIDTDNNEPVINDKAENDDEQPKPNDFVAVKLETRRTKQCFFAKVTEVENGENGDVCVEYLKKNGQHYMYPSVPDVSWQHKTDIVCKLAAPEYVLTGSRVKCVFRLNDIQVEILKPFKLK